MKNLTSLPSEKAFFDAYAPLAASVATAGVFAQVVSALTEIGIIYTGTAQSLAPLGLGWFAYVLAVAVAAIATAVIELGLRKTAPVAIDSILYRRWHGLHLPISIFVWLLLLVLLATSGLLSFSNSSVIVEQFTPPPAEQTTTSADSSYQAATATHRAVFVADSAAVAATYDSRIKAATAAADARIKATGEEIRGYENREARSGQSFGSAKDKLKQKQAEQEAAKAEEVALLEAEKAAALSEARRVYRSATATADSDYKAATGEVKAANQAAADGRAATIAGYGGGLGWFTVVCLFLFVVSIVLDRIHRKGAGITETVLIEGYDFRPGAIAEAVAAFRERANYLLHSKITAFANKTPPAPKPPQPAAVYDLADALKHITFKLELDDTGDTDSRVIYLSAKEPKEEAPPPRRIGFQQVNPAPPPGDPAPAPPTQPQNRANVSPSTNTDTQKAAHEPHTNFVCSKGTTEDVSLSDATQRLKMYKKRLGSHQQQAMAQERKDGKVCKRTADAVANNREWVAHYEQLIQQLKNGQP